MKEREGQQTFVTPVGSWRQHTYMSSNGAACIKPALQETGLADINIYDCI